MISMEKPPSCATGAFAVDNLLVRSRIWFYFQCLEDGGPDELRSIGKLAAARFPNRFVDRGDRRFRKTNADKLGRFVKESAVTALYGG